LLAQAPAFVGSRREVSSDQNPLAFVEMRECFQALDELLFFFFTAMFLSHSGRGFTRTARVHDFSPVHPWCLLQGC
jgi:hypothetical protein